MGFISMMVAMLGVLAVVILLVCGFAAGILIFIGGVVLNGKARKKNSKVKRRIARILIVLGLLIALFNVGLGILGRTALDLRSVKTPEGRNVISSDKGERALKLSKDDSPEAVAELKELIDGDPGLMYYKELDKSVVYNALECGNTGAVEILAEHGFDWNDQTFFTDGSLCYFIRKASEREITKDDVKILEILFDSGADPSLAKKSDGYSNIFGMTAWSVIYNREYDYRITDAELEFFRYVATKAGSSDPGFRFAGEEPAPKVKGALYTIDAPAPLEEDGNYKEVLKLLGREDAAQETIFRSVYEGEGE